MIRPMAKRKRSEHYVNNKEFLAALIKYREDKEIALIKGLLSGVVDNRDIFEENLNQLELPDSIAIIEDVIDNCLDDCK